MTEYLAVKTQNLLVEREEVFYVGGLHYKGLIDERTARRYDHPEDSYAKALGQPTDLEKGLIVPIEGNATGWLGKCENGLRDLYKYLKPTPSKPKFRYLTAGVC